MTRDITREQAEALIGIIKDPKVGLSGKTGKLARDIVAALAPPLANANIHNWPWEIPEAQKQFLRGVDAKVQRPYELEEVIGPFFDTIRES